MNIYSLILQSKYFIKITYSQFEFVPIPYYILNTKMNTGETICMASTLNALLYYKLLKTKNSIQTKFTHLKDCFENPFVTTTTKEDLLNEFSKTQRCYFVLYRFVQTCKWKKAKVHINTDLYMNELDSQCKRTFKILQNGKIYYFSVTDIVKIIRNSLTNSSYMFTIPLRARNPYTNVEFNKADLYNMYFKLKSVLLVVPSMIETYFRYDFDVYKLKKYHESDLMTQVVRNNIYNTWDTNYLHSTYLEMINMMNMKNKIRVDKDYPVQKLVNVMKPYLELYLLSKYLSNRVLQHNYECELRYRLHWFHTNNPTFGRKIYKAKRRKGKLYAPTITFKDVNLNCERIHESDFMRTHLYAEYNYNSYIYRGYFNTNTTYDTQYSSSSSESESESTQDSDSSENDNDDPFDDGVTVHIQNPAYNQNTSDLSVDTNDGQITGTPQVRVNAQIYPTTTTIETTGQDETSEDEVVIQCSDSEDEECETTQSQSQSQSHSQSQSQSQYNEPVDSDTDTVSDYGSDTWSYNRDEDYDW
jgi:hypothetical protein